MTATAPATPPATPRVRRTSVLEYLSSTDHKRIGVATVVVSIVYFFMGGALAVLMRTELATSGIEFLSQNTYNQVFTIHGSTMFYLFASPLAIGVGIYLVPLMIGAAELVWPRLALLGLWMFGSAGVIMWSGFLTSQGAANFGWTAFYPLSDSTSTPGTGADLWVLAVALSQAGVLLMAISLLATIVRRRAPGMTLMRIPIFVWTEIVTIFMVLTSYPVIVAAMGLLYIDRNAGDVFDIPGGTSTYLHLFWFWAHPVVYVVFFPLLGAVAEVVSTFSRRRFFGYSVTVLSLITFAALSTSVWGHHMFTMQTTENRFFSLSTTLILIPAGIEYFALIGTMFGGRIRFPAPMWFALGFILLFLIGGLTGIFVASPALDYHVHDTYFVVAHFHYTLFGGTVFGLFAAIYYWFPKATGRMLGETLGKWQAALMFVGALLAFIPMFFLGHEGMTRRVADYLSFKGWDTLNILSTVGAYVLFVAFVLFVVNVFRSLRAGRRAGNDPWQGMTLEWTTTSPPPRHNFERVLPVKTYAPLMDYREEGVDPHEFLRGESRR